MESYGATGSKPFAFITDAALSFLKKSIRAWAASFSLAAGSRIGIACNR
jgi:hypothetical protein